MLTILASLSDLTAASVDDDRGLVWVAQADGTLSSVDLTGQVRPGQVLTGPAVSLATNGRTLVAASADGTLVSLDPDDPGAAASTVLRARARFGQVAVTDSVAPSAAVVTAGARRLQPFPLPLPANERSLTLVRLAGGRTRSIPITGLTAVAIDGSTAYVARNTGLPGKGEVAQLLGSTTKVVATGLPPIGRLGLAEAGAVLLCSHPGSARLSAVRPATGAVQTVSTGTLPGVLVEAHGLADGLIAVLTSEVLALVDDLGDLTQDPTIDALTGPVFVGSWVELGYDLGTSGLAPGDLRFEVPDGPDAGFVSFAQQNGAGDPVPLLVVGGAVGPHKVVMVDTTTATEVAYAEFEITDHWTDDDTGPAGFYSTASSFDGASGWGGGPNSPQNIGTQPHTGTWRSLVLMVDTTSGRWPTGAALATNRADILRHVTDGFDVGGGVVRSARDYYEENSNFTGGATPKGLTVGVLNSQTFGPVNLPGSWTDYFEQGKDADGNITDNRWSSKGATVQTIISRALSDSIATTADFTNLDVLVIVPFSPDSMGAPPARFVWPHAHDALEFLCGTDAVADRRNLAYAFAPLDFAAHDGRHMHATLSHELGHTLGLPDLYSFPAYSDDIDARLTGDWDMMAGSRNRMPHYTISNKMRMGWVDAGHLRLFNFQGSSAAVQDVTLHASELGAPPAGRFRAIEIRLGNGWNYYVEYRAEQAGLSSDDLVTDRRVVITDVTSDTFTAPVARPPIVFVRNDLDGDGPLLGQGTDLEEKDPGTQMDLKVEVVSTDADHAVVRVSYGSNGKPEPGIRPWDGGPTWQSQDIEVRNDKATADPGKYFNVPWLGHDNTIVAKVKNSGDLLAKGVVVDFFVTEYSAGDGPWIPLGNDTRDIGPNATVEFTTQWNPSAADGKHYCVIVRIRLYQDPGNLAVVDQNIYNNEARSNYTKFVSASASPSSRVGTSVLLANPFETSTHVFAAVRQTHGQHRVFVDHQWLRVDGLGRRPVQVWDEALWGHPEWDRQDGHPGDKRQPSFLWEVPNQVSVTGWAVRPFETDCGARTLTGGVGLRVDAGRETEIVVRAAKRTYVSGEVRYVDTGSGVTSRGVVLVEVVALSGKSFTVSRDLDAQGGFTLELPDEFGDETSHLVVHYLGSYGAAPCESERVGV